MVLLFLLGLPFFPVKSVALLFSLDSSSVIFRVLDTAPVFKKVLIIHIFLKDFYLAHQRGAFYNSLNISESLDIKLKPGGDPALIPVAELLVNKPL